MATATDLQWHSVSLASAPGVSGEASAWVRDLAERAGLSEERTYVLDLAAVEIVSNIADHSYLGKKGSEIRLDLALGPDKAILTFIDHGPEFDPLKVPPPAPTTLDDATIGGLGIQMVRATSDACRYERRDGLNYFTVFIGTK